MTPPPTTKTTTVTVGGHAYRVTSSATADELARFAALVDERLLTLPLSQRGDPKSLVLVALGLAHDLEHERLLRATERLEVQTRVRGLLARIDGALGQVDANGEPLEAPAPAGISEQKVDGKEPRSGQAPAPAASVAARPGTVTQRVRESGST